MSLVRYAPRFPTMFRDFDDLFRSFGSAPYKIDEATDALVPPADVKETAKAIEVHLDMPGLNPDAIDVRLDGNLLTISAEREESSREEKDGWLRQERSWGRMSRSFTLPATLEGAAPDASYKHGVLKVVLPKKEVQQPKTAKVRVES